MAVSSTYRLRHAPLRELSDAELEDAHRRRFISDGMYAAERGRRRVRSQLLHGMRSVAA
jgi:hypothetical protein